MTDEREPDDGPLGGITTPLDTDEGDVARLWESDDDDAEDTALDDGPDDLVSDESRADRGSYWGG